MGRVVLENLTCRRDEAAVLDRFSLALPPDELTLVLGPANSGKSFLVRALAGLERIDEGEIQGGRKVGAVFAADSIWPHLSVAENVGFGPKVRGAWGRERRKWVVDALALAGIDSLGPRRPETLSPEQRLRVELARALAIGPELLAIDDPFSRTERGSHVDLMADLKRLAREAEVPILVTGRDRGEHWGAADQLAAMDLGRALQAGPPQDLYDCPTTARVAEALGPANLIGCRALGTRPDGHAVVETPWGPWLARGGSRLSSSQVGTSLLAMVRPESFEFGAASGPNRFEAGVVESVVQGPWRRLVLGEGPDRLVQALVPASRLGDLRVGGTIGAMVPPDRVVLLGPRT